MRLDLLWWIWQEVGCSFEYGIFAIRIDQRDPRMWIHDSSVSEVLDYRLTPPFDVRPLQFEFDPCATRSVPVEHPEIKDLRLVLACIDDQLAVVSRLIVTDL